MGEMKPLSISWCAPDKVRYQSLKFDCKGLVLYYPLLFLFNYNMALLGVISPPFIFVPSKRNSKVWLRFIEKRNIITKRIMLMSIIYNSGSELS